MPTASDTHTMTASAIVQSSASPGNAVVRRRSASTSAVTFVAAAMKAVTGVGAPSYTSGVHMWNGAAETLKPSPTMIIARPASRKRSSPSSCASVAAAISEKPSSPVAP